jgi:hypothetical protein
MESPIFEAVFLPVKRFFGVAVERRFWVSVCLFGDNRTKQPGGEGSCDPDLPEAGIEAGKEIDQIRIKKGGSLNV